MEDNEKLIFGFADNSLSDPIECIRYLFEELIKVGHKVVIYTYQEHDYEKMTELEAFMKELNVDIILTNDKEIEADIFYDAKNFGGIPGFYPLFVSCLQGGVIATTQINIKKFDDIEFWETGKSGSGIIKLDTPKIELL